MSRLPLVVLAPIALVLAGCQQSADTSSDDATTEAKSPEPLGTAALKLADGLPAGTAELMGEGNKVTISIALTGLLAGSHAVHLHTTGSCEAPDFKSAGGHLNPDGKQHGTDNPMGAHLGDLPNVVVGEDGTGKLTATLKGAREDVLAAIFDDDGSAVVVHEGPDDYKSDPAGAAGSRVACGVIEAAAP